MPYTLPTEADFRDRFPIFADKDGAAIVRSITEASNEVDDSWLEADYQPAVLYLAAHLLVTDNTGEGEDVNIGGVPGPITSESFSGLGSVTYGARYTGLSASDAYGSTEYGRRFLKLLRNNRGGPLVV